MAEKLTWTRLRAVFTASIAIALALLVTAGTARAGTRADAADGRDGPPVGPALVSPLGHQGLCWQGEGNGSSITLEACSASVQGQLWTFNGDGVVMNGNGYCLQNGSGGSPAQQGSSLFLSFSGQCAGAASQVWAFSGLTNMITNSAAGVCAYPQGGADIPGAAIVGRPCGSVRSAARWSFGVSRLTLGGPRRAARARAQSGAGTARGTGSTAGAGTASGANTGTSTRASGGTTGARREFSAEVTVVNATGAMTAYGATVWLRQPKGLRVARLTGSGGLSDWTCTVPKLRCQGSLAGGLNGKLIIGGAVTSPSPAQKITVRAAVTRTNEARRGIRPVRVPVRVFSVAAAVALPGGGPHSSLTSSTAKYGLIIAILLVAAGIALAVFSRRRPQPGAAHAAQAPAYPTAPTSQDTAPLITGGTADQAREETAPLAVGEPAAPARQDAAPVANGNAATPVTRDSAAHEAKDAALRGTRE